MGQRGVSSNCSYPIVRHTCMPLLLDMIGLILHLWDSEQRPDVGENELTHDFAPLSCSTGTAGTGLKHLCPSSDLFEMWAREFRVSVLSLSCMHGCLFLCRSHRHYGSAHELAHKCALVFVHGSRLCCKSLLHCRSIFVS
jgi:hypothetical protein